MNKHIQGQTPKKMVKGKIPWSVSGTQKLREYVEEERRFKHGNDNRDKAVNQKCIGKKKTKEGEGARRGVRRVWQ